MSGKSILSNEEQAVSSMNSENAQSPSIRNRELVRRYKAGDLSSRDELIEANMNLIKWCAKKFVNRSREYDNQNNMPYLHKAYYFRYFRRIEGSSRLRNYVTVPEAITLDLIKDRNDDWFDVNEASREDFLKFLRTKGKSLSVQSKNTLMLHFGVSPRELMSGSEQMKVLHFLANTNLKTKTLALEKK